MPPPPHTKPENVLKLVLKKFIELAEAKVTEAQAKADEVQSTLEPTAGTGANVEDLEAIETPESILLSTVSGEQSRDRTDRAIVTPWLKFLWETYRTVLEILKNNARLEVMYQSTAMLAFSFCQNFVRKTEFRRLCELLRNHVQNAAKYQSQMHAINLSDPDTLQRHLDTRFQQLNVAVELELWQEAFRSVEDIHTLLSLSKRPAKNIMMANYYEKLTRIFLVSENYLFHAAAWSRYYNLMRQSANIVASGQSSKKDNPAVTEADMSRAASFVLLSALSIPVISTSRSRGALIDVDEARKNKNNRLTNLLGMSHAPTRAVLFKDAMSKGLLKRARPEIRELYQILEVDFHPLSICKKISPILTQIGSDPEMEKYVLPLQQVILTRLFQQLSQVYESVQLDYVHKLAQFPAPFEVTPASIEKFIMNGCKKGDLAIRIDHATGVLTFDSDVFSSAKAMHPGSGSGSAENEASSVQQLQRTPAEIVRSQLTRLAKTLYVTCQYVDPEYNEAREQAKAAALSRAQAGAEQEHQETLARRAVIEKKKELASDALQKKQKEEETRKRIIAQQRQEAETLRLSEEHKERERKRMKDEQDRIRRENNEKELSDLVKKGINIGDVDVKDLDSNQLRLLRISQLEKEKNDLFKNLRVTGKRIDHLERAFRKEEIKLLPKDYEAQRELDFAAYEKSKSETLKESRRKHEEDVALKHRLSRLLPVYEEFHQDLRDRRHDEFEKRRKAADREYQSAIDKRKREVRERKAREQREIEEAERRAQEEEERIAREAEEKAAIDEEKKRLAAEAKAKRDAERKELDEKAAIQRRREEEVEKKLAERKAGLGSRIPDRTAPSRAPDMARTESRDGPAAGGPPKLNLAGNKPTWRERQAAKEAEEATKAAGGHASAPPPAAPPTEIATEEAALPKRTGGYVPPARRDGAPRGRPDAASSPAPPRDASSSVEPTAKWRPGARGDAAGRDGSPADSLKPRFPGLRRDPSNRDTSPADRPVSSSGTARTESPAASEKPAPGKYVPMHMRR
ncbi:translation initiation factor 3 subunit A, partial [Lecanoromycetidae sp. Uapishka_2]